MFKEKDIQKQLCGQSLWPQDGLSQELVRSWDFESQRCLRRGFCQQPKGAWLRIRPAWASRGEGGMAATLQPVGPRVEDRLKLWEES